MIAKEPGRLSYHPAVLLKLYIYGYLNRVQSSRRLEREACRNIEVMWLIGRLAPDHKTIADFRKDNGAAIRKVCAKFVALRRQMGLLQTPSRPCLLPSGNRAVLCGLEWHALNCCALIEIDRWWCVGSRSVATLANGLGCSSRHLARLFERHVGASPQQVAKTTCTASEALV